MGTYVARESLKKEWKPGATTISEELEGIGCLSTREPGKRHSTIVQPLPPLLHSSFLQ